MRILGLGGDGYLGRPTARSFGATAPTRQRRRDADLRRAIGGVDRGSMLHPKRPGSFHHLSKVDDSHTIEFACRAWGLAAADLNQGIVYGQQTEETARHSALATRFDDDVVFATVLNRPAVPAVCGHPLTVTERHRRNVDASLFEPTVRWTAEADRVAPRAPAALG
ncbi:MAG: hypothetical protein ACYCU7_13110 [Acidimicrobiales bacterium]